MAEKLILASNALEALSRKNVNSAFLAGGTEDNRLNSTVNARTLISIGRIKELDGISLDGDMVRIFNDRGEVVVRAQVSAGTRPGMVILPKGWEADQFVKGHYSDLTASPFNPTVPNNCYYDALCEVEKY